MTLSLVSRALCFLLVCTAVGTISIPQETSGQATRPLADTVGYAHTPAQIEAIVSMCDSILTADPSHAAERTGIESGDPWIAGICPHDDHIYAGPLYVDLIQNIKADHVILFGVAHRASQHELEERLIFDSFKSWRGPYGPVNVSPLREEILNNLSPADYVVHDEIQSVEHSVEGLIPFLQHGNREVQIVSILVPYMEWERLDELSRELGRVLRSILEEDDLHPGRDIAFLLSNDCVHYGDQGWGGKNYAPFGADVDGYTKAVRRDRKLIDDFLVGDVESGKLPVFFERLVDPQDVKTYRVTWCGRFSVPFGLNCLEHLLEDLDHPPMEGTLLGYDTSVATGELPVRELGLGSTAPSNLRHWVGYCAVGYR